MLDTCKEFSLYYYYFNYLNISLLAHKHCYWALWSLHIEDMYRPGELSLKLSQCY